MGIDPAELRRRNMIPPEAMPYQTALSFKYDCGEFEHVMDEALEEADYHGFAARRAEARKRGKLRGLGLSYTIERAAQPLRGSGHPLRSQRFAHFGHRGGGARAGTRNDLQADHADKLGIGPDHVHLSRATATMCSSVKEPADRASRRSAVQPWPMAADQVIAKAKKIAAHMLKADDLELVDGVFRQPSDQQDTLDGGNRQGVTGRQELPAGVEAGLNTTATYQRPQLNFPNGCHIAEVEIDPKTGAVEIVRYVVVDDFGTVLNPLLLDGQVLGGIAQGAGQVLMEEIRFDPDSGQILTGSFMDYAMPQADMLPRIEVKSHPVPTRPMPLAPRCGRGGLRRIAAGARQCSGRCAVRIRRPPCAHAASPENGLADHSQRAAEGKITAMNSDRFPRRTRSHDPVDLCRSRAARPGRPGHVGYAKGSRRQISGSRQDRAEGQCADRGGGPRRVPVIWSRHICPA